MHTIACPNDRFCQRALTFLDRFLSHDRRQLRADPEGGECMCSRESDSVGLGTLLIVTAIRVRGGEDTRVFRIAQEALPSWDCTRAITGRVEPLRALRAIAVGSPESVVYS